MEMMLRNRDELVLKLDEAAQKEPAVGTRGKLWGDFHYLLLLFRLSAADYRFSASLFRRFHCSRNELATRI